MWNWELNYDEIAEFSSDDNEVLPACHTLILHYKEISCLSAQKYLTVIVEGVMQDLEYGILGGIC